MKKWFTKDVSEYTLTEELNAFSQQGYEICKIFENWVLHERFYTIIAYKNE